MQDQSQQLPCLLPSLVLSGTIQPSELLHCIDLIRSGIIKIIFLSPERLFSSFFQRLLKETDLVLTQINLNDGTPEGISHKELPLHCIQYHPEAGPGPNDTRNVFDKFNQMMDEY